MLHYCAGVDPISIFLAVSYFSIVLPHIPRMESGLAFPNVLNFFVFCGVYNNCTDTFGQGCWTNIWFILLRTFVWVIVSFLFKKKKNVSFR